MKDSTNPLGPRTSGKRSDTKEDSQMVEKENDENLIDPPSNDGGNKAELDSGEEMSPAIDPPSNDGGN
jgi:hypothetical protein